MQTTHYRLMNCHATGEEEAIEVILHTPMQAQRILDINPRQSSALCWYFSTSRHLLSLILACPEENILVRDKRQILRNQGYVLNIRHERYSEYVPRIFRKVTVKSVRIAYIAYTDGLRRMTWNAPGYEHQRQQTHGSEFLQFPCGRSTQHCATLSSCVPSTRPLSPQLLAALEWQRCGSHTTQRAGRCVSPDHTTPTEGRRACAGSSGLSNNKFIQNAVTFLTLTTQNSDSRWPKAYKKAQSKAALQWFVDCRDRMRIIHALHLPHCESSNVLMLWNDGYMMDASKKVKSALLEQTTSVCASMSALYAMRYLMHSSCPFRAAQCKGVHAF